MSFSLLLEIVSLVCAFILPRLILVNFGSEYNGVVTSITQFLSCVTLLRAGAGGVTRAALYKPLAERDDYTISSILKATENFMRRVAIIFSVFLLLLAAVYPLFVKEEFDWFYTFTLVLILGISTFTQYYFGIANQMLLQADQRQYIYCGLQTVATILNTILCLVLINNGIEFRLVKLGSSLVFGALPICLHIFVRKKYNIIKNAPADDTALTQRWDAFAHQIAAFVHTNTDIVLLTLFSNLYQVSIYTVYTMVTNGVRKFVDICSSGIDSAIGKVLARNEKHTLSKGFAMYEWLVHVVATVFFTCTAMLILPFVMIYTKGVDDTDYFQPLLGYLLCVSQFLTCIRLPYKNVVEAAGQFRQTRNGAVAEAVINISVSIPLIILCGSAGAVAGTIAATTFRTVQYAVYASNKILKRPCAVFVKRFLVSVCSILVLLGPFILLNISEYLLNASTYLAWIRYSILVFLIVLFITMMVNYLTYPSLTCRILGEVKTLFSKKLK